MLLQNLFIKLFSVGSIFSSIFTIISVSEIFSVIMLIFTFVQAALYLILMNITFVGISYIVIYVGAIAVLFLFVIMMINIDRVNVSQIGLQYTKNLPLAGLIVAIFFILFTELLSSDIKYIPSFSFLFNDNNIGLSLFSETWDNLFYQSDSFLNVIELKNIASNNFIWDTSITEFEHIASLGFNLYTDNSVLLIILSIILLLSMFASIILSRSPS